MLTATEGDRELAREKLAFGCAWKRSTLDGWRAARAAEGGARGGPQSGGFAKLAVFRKPSQPASPQPCRIPATQGAPLGGADCSISPQCKRARVGESLPRTHAARGARTTRR